MTDIDPKWTAPAFLLQRRLLLAHVLAGWIHRLHPSPKTKQDHADAWEKLNADPIAKQMYEAVRQAEQEPL